MRASVDDVECTIGNLRQRFTCPSCGMDSLVIVPRRLWQTEPVLRECLMCNWYGRRRKMDE